MYRCAHGRVSFPDDVDDRTAPETNHFQYSKKRTEHNNRNKFLEGLEQPWYSTDATRNDELDESAKQSSR